MSIKIETTMDTRHPQPKGEIQNDKSLHYPPMPMKYNGMVTVGVVAAVLRVDEAQPLDVKS